MDTPGSLEKVLQRNALPAPNSNAAQPTRKKLEELLHLFDSRGQRAFIAIPSLARHPFIVMVGFPVSQSILTVAFVNSRVNTAAEDPPPCVHTPCGSPKSVWYSGGNG